MPIKNYYQILELREDASDEDIRQAFRAKIRTCHPEIDDSESAKEQFQDTIEAFDVLSNKTKRKAFDEVLANEKMGIPVTYEQVEFEQWEEQAEERSKKYREFPLEELLMLEIFAETGVIDGLLNVMGDIIDSAGDALDGLSDLF